MHRIVFLPSGKRGEVADGTSILDAARQLGVDLDSVCGGRAICGRCQISPAIGDFPKHAIHSKAEHLTPPGQAENRYAEKRTLAADRRLGCSTLIHGDVIIDVPPDSQVHRQVVRKRAEVRDITVDPIVRLHYLQPEKPDMHDPKSDLERLTIALAEQWDIHDPACDLHVMRDLQKALRSGEWGVTVAVHNRRDIIAVWPEFHDRALGLAIDVGSTTLAAHLCDLGDGAVLASGGLMNPQIRFGEDLMSRVSYVMMNPGGDAEMTAVVRGAINDLAAQVAAEAGADINDILDVVLVGNPVMHHLLLGIDPTELGGAPFALATGLPVDGRAADLGLSLHPGARFHVLPCIAGHVGADTAAVVLSEAPYLRDDVSLIVDVGTNAEIVLGGKQRLLAASSPTGPAFEGAQISGGQRAAPGAIERVRIDPETLRPRFKVIGSDLWSDDPQFVEDSPGITGICGSGIIEVIAEMFLTGLLGHDGTINPHGKETPGLIADGRTFSYLLHESEPRISITQNDVRAIQLAKAALHAGARLLMDHMDIQAVDRIVLAGAFGSHIDPIHAMVLGLIPDCPPKQVSSAGNAAGTGARIALLNAAAREEIIRVTRTIEKIETAIEPKFQEHFVEAMAFPHATAPSPNLAKVVDLPPSPPPAAKTRRRRQGRS